MPFNMFPYSNLHEINADWLLKEVKEAAENAAEAAQDAQEAAATMESYDDRLEAVEGRLDSDEAVLEKAVLVTAQSLETAEKTQARTNIGAASQADMSVAQSDIAGKVDINGGSAKWLKILDSGSGNNGVALGAIGGSPDKLVMQPVSGGNIDYSSYARVAVANPTDNNDAVNKQYLNTEMQAFALKTAGNLESPRIIIGDQSGDGVNLNAEADHDGYPVLDLKQVDNSIVQTAKAGLIAKDVTLVNQGTGGVTLSQGLTGPGNNNRNVEVHLYNAETGISNVLAAVKVATPYQEYEATTKKYVDEALQEKLDRDQPEAATSLKITGTDPKITLEDTAGKVIATLDDSNKRITLAGQWTASPTTADPVISGVGTPQVSSDAVNKGYVDSLAPFVVTYTRVDRGTATCDKTWNDIQAAITAGKRIEVHLQAEGPTFYMDTVHYTPNIQLVATYLEYLDPQDPSTYLFYRIIHGSSSISFYEDDQM